MQRRAIRDAKTPDKMKKSKAVQEDSNLTLQEKKDKIKSGLKRLTELGTVNPKNRYQDLINDVAKVGARGLLALFAGGCPGGGVGTVAGQDWCLPPTLAEWDSREPPQVILGVQLAPWGHLGTALPSPL